MRDEPSPPILGPVVDITHPSQDPWRAQPARPGTRDRHCPPIPGHVADIDCPSRDEWQAQGPPVPVPVANIARPPQDPWRVIAPTRTPDPWRTMPARCGAYSGFSLPVLGPVACTARSSQDRWRAQPAGPRTHGGHRPPPVPGPARPSCDPWQTSPAHPGTLGGPSPPNPEPAVLGPEADITRPSQLLWRAQPARPRNHGGHHPPVLVPMAGPAHHPGQVADIACPSQDPWRALPATVQPHLPAGRSVHPGHRPSSPVTPGDDFLPLEGNASSFLLSFASSTSHWSPHFSFQRSSTSFCRLWNLNSRSFLLDSLFSLASFVPG
ncbi:basic proline-rich protein-like [Macrobrachium nipponense]|uniref:basic proline-rich protein-like n=1 Tax=Macrobrachium nipponense TaxID=159736 RepID=UPI0030C87F8F